MALPVNKLPDLAEWKDGLKQMPFSGRINWSDHRQWHLTLKFIGDVDEEGLEHLRESLRKSLAGIPKGEIAFEGSGFFGHPGAPRVVWAGVRPGVYLDRLKTMVEEGASVLDLPYDDRPFRPHLTLCRIKRLEEPGMLKEEVDRNRDTFWGHQPVDHVVLYKSRLTSGGPVYSVVEQFDLMEKE